jgi:hypothetical protein
MILKPKIWPLKIAIIAHDVGRTNDRSTAVVGGNLPPIFGPGLLGVEQFLELQRGLYGSALANELGKVDQFYNRDCLILADLSNDASYAEALYELFGQRVIGVQIGRSGDGTTFEHRPVKNGAVLVYRVGRSFLLDLLLADLRNGRIRLPDNEDSRHAFSQLEGFEPEQRETGVVYKCPAGQHDDLAMSLAMVAWAAQHLHFDRWTRPIFDAHRPRRAPIDGRRVWNAFT